MEDLEEIKEVGIQEGMLKGRLLYSVKRMLEAQEVLATLRSRFNHAELEDIPAAWKETKAKINFKYHMKELGELLKDK